MNDYHRNKHFQFGTTNPTLMDKPFWKYMVANSDKTSYEVSRRFRSIGCEIPIWCFARFGASQTYLPNGRLIQIGGEHEDSYDPDFQIYNDVVVITNPHIIKSNNGYAIPMPDTFPYAKKRQTNSGYHQKEMLGTSNESDVTIFGYPEDVFPPTDFHTATYMRNYTNEGADEFIYIIGGLGYVDSPHRRETQVYRLRLSDYSIQQIKTSGNGPQGEVSEHIAKLVTEEDRKMIEITLKDGQRYRLDIETAVWKSLQTDLFSQSWSQL